MRDDQEGDFKSALGLNGLEARVEIQICLVGLTIVNYGLHLSLTNSAICF